MQVVREGQHVKVVEGAWWALRRAINWMNDHGYGETDELWENLTEDALVWHWIQAWAKLRMTDSNPDSPPPPLTGTGWRIEFSSVSLEKGAEVTARAVVAP